MSSKDHSDLKGTHALISGSKVSWLRYDDEKLFNTYVSGYAQQVGTVIHDLACDLITEKIKLNKQDRHLVLHHLCKNKIPRNVYNLDFIYPNFMNYVNDAIGFRMEAEKCVYYSENAYGWADAISFRDNLLRIHDLKTGVSPSPMEQLEIYSAFYCLEHNIKPENIDIELRIYKANEIIPSNPNPEKIQEIMNRTIIVDKYISNLKAEGM